MGGLFKDASERNCSVMQSAACLDAVSGGENGNLGVRLQLQDLLRAAHPWWGRCEVSSCGMLITRDADLPIEECSQHELYAPATPAPTMRYSMLEPILGNSQPGGHCSQLPCRPHGV